MSGTEVALIMSAFGTLITAAGQVWNNYNSRRIEKNTNSIKDALVATTAKAAHAEGMIQGAAAERENKT